MSRALPKSVGAGSPTPLADYLTQHNISATQLGKRLNIHDQTVFNHARGLRAPTIGIAFIYHEQLGIDIRHWANVPVVRASGEEWRRDPETRTRMGRCHDRRHRPQRPDHNHSQKARLKRMVKEGKAYYGLTPGGHSTIYVKPEFRQGAR